MPSVELVPQIYSGIGCIINCDYLDEYQALISKFNHKYKLVIYIDYPYESNELDYPTCYGTKNCNCSGERECYYLTNLPGVKKCFIVENDTFTENEYESLQEIEDDLPELYHYTLNEHIDKKLTNILSDRVKSMESDLQLECKYWSVMTNFNICEIGKSPKYFYHYNNDYADAINNFTDFIKAFDLRYYKKIYNIESD